MPSSGKATKKQSFTFSGNHDGLKLRHKMKGCCCCSCFWAELGIDGNPAGPTACLPSSRDSRINHPNLHLISAMGSQSRPHGWRGEDSHQNKSRWAFALIFHPCLELGLKNLNLRTWVMNSSFSPVQWESLCFSLRVHRLLSGNKRTFLVAAAAEGADGETSAFKIRKLARKKLAPSRSCISLPPLLPLSQLRRILLITFAV